MKALLIVDLQNDFLPGGALPISNGDEIIEPINQLQNTYDLIIASKDWHPSDHCSFESNWPAHCIQNTYGADFPKKLQTQKIAAIFNKGEDAAKEAYSAFDAPGLEAFLREQGVDALDLVGLALDVCIKATALDAVKRGFKVTVLTHACRGLGSEQEALEQMASSGVIIS